MSARWFPKDKRITLILETNLLVKLCEQKYEYVAVQK